MIYSIRKKNKRAFVLLFAVILSSIILSIALGIANIAYQEIKFTTSGRNTNDAFLAADTGVECALYNDRSSINKFPIAGPATAISCGGASITPTFSGSAGIGSYNFVITSLGGLSQACAKIAITKTSSPTATTMIIKGYNIGDSSCNSTSPNRVERELDVNY